MICVNVWFSGAMALLRPLLLDVAPDIQQTAALALGRLANYNEDLAEAVVKGDILPQLVYSLAEQNVMLTIIFAIKTTITPVSYMQWTYKTSDIQMPALNRCLL